MIIDKQCSLAAHSTIRLGGVCEGYFPENEAELIGLVEEFENRGIEYLVVGNMSNILPTDGKASSKVIFCERIRDITVSFSMISLGCGNRMSSVILSLAKDQKVLLPSLVGIPGMVGGMVAQNASCFGEELASSFVYATLYSALDKKVIRLNREEMGFAYRTSILKREKMVLLNAAFDISDGNAISTIESVRKRRQATAPEGPSLGSVFLKHNDMSIGRLLDELKQKGRSFGGISVSRKHAGVLINSGCGTASEYKEAVFALQEIVRQNYGFVPQREIIYLR